MSRSLIQTANATNQSVLANGIISPGAVIRRFGPNINLSGSSIALSGSGYYTVDAIITLTATTPGELTVAIYEDGKPIDGATASFTTTAATDVVTFTIPTTVRIKDCCGTKSITGVLVTGEGVVVSNFAVRVVKE